VLLGAAAGREGGAWPGAAWAAPRPVFRALIGATAPWAGRGGGPAVGGLGGSAAMPERRERGCAWLHALRGLGYLSSACGVAVGETGLESRDSFHPPAQPRCTLQSSSPGPHTTGWTAPPSQCRCYTRWGGRHAPGGGAPPAPADHRRSLCGLQCAIAQAAPNQIPPSNPPVHPAPWKPPTPVCVLPCLQSVPCPRIESGHSSKEWAARWCCREVRRARSCTDTYRKSVERRGEEKRPAAARASVARCCCPSVE
jgi:hypothetical protein